MKLSKRLEKGRKLRRSRNFMPSGRARTHLQHIASAAAINLARLFDWLSGEGPGDSWVSDKELDSSLHIINHA